MPLLLLLFTVVPFVELWLLLQIGERLGAFNTFALVILTGFAGASLARWQGWQAMSRIQSEMKQGMLPAAAVFDGVLILAAGLLLVTPGVLTDAVGLSLLLPPVRTLVRRLIRRWFSSSVQVSTTAAWTDASGETHVYGSQAGPRSVVVDAQVVDSTPDRERPAIDG
ncbi:MAG: FxsA family protein [Planctomycetota bacterium]